MKTIGMIGGMSCESTMLYYQLINRETKRRLGGHHNAPSVLVTVDFDEVARLQHDGLWPALGRLMAETARQVERAGADCIVLCTNTMHLVSAEIEAATAVPFLHIAEATAESIQQAGLNRVGFMGTRFTMEHTFFRERLERRGIDVLIPDEASRNVIHDVIYSELVHGIVRPESRSRYCAVIEEFARGGAQGVILGCTEIGLLLHPADSPLPLFDTTRIHADAAVNWSLADLE